MEVVLSCKMLIEGAGRTEEMLANNYNRLTKYIDFIYDVIYVHGLIVTSTGPTVSLGNW